MISELQAQLLNYRKKGYVMLKMSKWSFALALSLLLSLSMFTSGVFAQSVEHSDTSGTVRAIVATTNAQATGQTLQVAQTGQTNLVGRCCGYGNGNGNVYRGGYYHPPIRRSYTKCVWRSVRVGFRWVRTRSCRRVWY
jgi:hypothetical protein